MKLKKQDIIQFMKFNLVGVLNTGVDMGMFALLTLFGLNDFVAQIISYSCGVVNSYLFNSNWTFRRERKRTPREMLLFLVVNLVSLSVSLFVMYACESWLGIENSIVRKLFATAASVVVNFLGNKLFVFRTKDAEIAGDEQTGEEEV